jgi:hypothetical protein
VTRRVVRRSLLVVAAMSATSLDAAPARAAPVFVTVGQTAPAGSGGGCTLCSSVQRSATVGPTSASYVFPYDGVVTRFTARTGSSLSPLGEWMQARTFRLGDATHARVMSEGARSGLTTASTWMTFWDRIRASAGDVLGAKFETGPGVAQTPNIFSTVAGDTTSTASPGPAVGGDAVTTDV